MVLLVISFGNNIVEQMMSLEIKEMTVCVLSQVGENEPFVSELLTTLRTTIVDLEPHQIHSFYESVGSLHVAPINLGYMPSDLAITT